MLKKVVGLSLLFSLLPVRLVATNQELISLREALQSACPNSDTEKYYLALLPLVRSLKTESWQATAKAMLAKACALEMPDWRLRIAFSLAHYGLENGLQPHTVSQLTEILAKDSIGKEEYLKTGQLWEKMSEVGMREAEQAELIQFGRKKNLRALQLEGLVLLYLHFRKEGLNFTEALDKVSEVLPLLQKTHRTDQVNKIVREKILPEEKNKFIPEQELWHLFRNST